MARIRTIKPEFQNSQSMGRVSRDARLLFIELWPQCDDAGRIRANSRMLASILFPYDLDAFDLIDQWLAELENEACIVRYRVGNDAYLQVCHWDHQKIDHPKPSDIPPPPAKKVRKTKLSPREDSRSVATVREEPTNVRAVSSTIPDHTGKDQGGASRFNDFWMACPKKVGKGKAEQLFIKALPVISADRLIAAITRYGDSQHGKDPTYIKHPATWLSQKCWEDEDVGTAPVSAEIISIREAFQSPEELEGQRLMMEKFHGKASN